MGVIARATDAADAELVAAVREGDDAAFEELYRRYNRRIAGYVCRMVGDPDRAEDVTQEAFFAALRRLRQTDAEITFKPWIFEIAKNAAIDHFRRTSRAQEVSIHAEDGLRAADHIRLVGGSPAPETAFDSKQRLDHLRGAFAELSESHSRILVLRELEGLSYREIGERMDLTRPAVESTLFRARRRLGEEYEELDTGARCLAVVAAIARLAEGFDSARDRRRVGRHIHRCSACARHARELGVSVETPVSTRVAALLPLPALARRRRGAGHDGGAGSVAGSGCASSVQQVATAWAPAMVTTGAAEGTAQVWSKAAAIVAAIALAGGGAAIHEKVIDRDGGSATVAPAAPGGSGTVDGDAGSSSPAAPGGTVAPGGRPATGDDRGASSGPTGHGPSLPGGAVRTPGGGGHADAPSVGSPQLDAPGVQAPGFQPPSFDTPGLPPASGDRPSLGDQDRPDPGLIDRLRGGGPSLPTVGDGLPFSLESPAAPATPELPQASPSPALPEQLPEAPAIAPSLPALTG